MKIQMRLPKLTSVTIDDLSASRRVISKKSCWQKKSFSSIFLISLKNTHKLIFEKKINNFNCALLNCIIVLLCSTIISLLKALSHNFSAKKKSLFCLNNCEEALLFKKNEKMEVRIFGTVLSFLFSITDPPKNLLLEQPLLLKELFLLAAVDHHHHHLWKKKHQQALRPSYYLKNLWCCK